MQQDLAAVPRSEFTQYLIGKCELRVKTIWFERIQGLFWLREPADTEPLRPGSSRDDVIKAFFDKFLDYEANPKTDVVDLTAYPNTPMESRNEVLLHRQDRHFTPHSWSKAFIRLVCSILHLQSKFTYLLTSIKALKYGCVKTPPLRADFESSAKSPGARFRTIGKTPRRARRSCATRSKRCIRISTSSRFNFAKSWA